MQFSQLTRDQLCESSTWFAELEIQPETLDNELRFLKASIKGRFGSQVRHSGGKLKEESEKRMDLWAKLCKGFGTGQIGRCRELRFTILADRHGTKVKLGQRFRKHNKKTFAQIKSEWINHWQAMLKRDTQSKDEPGLLAKTKKVYHNLQIEAVSEKKRIVSPHHRL